MPGPGPLTMDERLKHDYRWTSRQRQVLDGLVAGKTNQQIGDDLGITLDGAKWHVSEILRLLGADTREEAAEYWRRANGLAPRFARVFRGVAGLSTVQVAYGAIGVLAIAGLVVAVVLFVGADDDQASDPDGLAIHPGDLLVAIAGVDPQAQATTLRIVNTATGGERTLTDNEPFAGLQFSPDGRFLLTLRPAGQNDDDSSRDELEVSVWDSRGTAVSHFVVGPLLRFGNAVWTPDSNDVMVYGPGGARFYDRRGKLRAETGPFPPRGTSSGQQISSNPWAPDGRHAGLSFDGAVTIVGRDGTLIVLDPATSGVADAAGNYFFAGFADNSTAWVLNNRVRLEVWAVNFDTQPPRWERLDGDAWAIDRGQDVDARLARIEATGLARNEWLDLQNSVDSVDVVQVVDRGNASFATRLRILPEGRPYVDVALKPDEQQLVRNSVSAAVVR